VIAIREHLVIILGMVMDDISGPMVKRAR